MTSEGGKQVRRLGRELSRHAEAIEAIVVTGCTDAAVPFADSNYSNNYELSLARAVVIVVELNRESRLPRDVFTAKGSDVNSLACTGGPDLKLPAARTVSLRIVFKK
jgi:flagellar motor protein MotB